MIWLIFLLLFCTYLILNYANGFIESTSVRNEASKDLIAESVNRIDEESVAIISTVDGFIHAFDSNMDEKWKIDLGGPLATSHVTDDDPKYSVIPSIDGSIMIHSRDGMSKTSVKARMLAEKAPFMSNQDGLVVTSQKTNRILGVDLMNGRIFHDTGMDGNDANPTSNNLGNPQGLRSLTLKDQRRKPLWLGRTDYTLRAFDQATGLQAFNLTFSEVEPLDNELRPLPQHQMNPHDSSLASDNPNDKKYLPYNSKPNKTNEKRSIKSLLSWNGKQKPNHDSDSDIAVMMNPTDPELSPLISTPEGDIFFADTKGNMYHRVAMGSPAAKAFLISNYRSDTNENAMDDPIDSPETPININPMRIAYRSSPLSAFNYDTDLNKPKSKSDSNNHPFATDSEMNPSVVVVQSLQDGGYYAIEMTSSHDKSLSKLNPSYVTKIKTKMIDYGDNIHDDSCPSETEQSAEDRYPYDDDLNDATNSIIDFNLYEEAINNRGKLGPASGGKLSNLLLESFNSFDGEDDHDYDDLNQDKLEELAHGRATFSSLDQLRKFHKSLNEIGSSNYKRYRLFDSKSSLELNVLSQDNLPHQETNFGTIGLTGDGRMCRLYPYQQDDLTNPSDKSKSSYDTKLPACIDGNHRLLPLSKLLQRQELIHTMKSKSRNYVVTEEFLIPDFLMNPHHYFNLDHPHHDHIHPRQDHSLNSYVFHTLHIIETFVLFIFLFMVLIAIFLYGVLFIFEPYLPQPVVLTIRSTIHRMRNIFSRFNIYYQSDIAHVHTVPPSLSVTKAQPDEEITEEVIDQDGNKVTMTKIGSLLVSSQKLGLGSQGTVVLKGSLNGRPVAVKRMLSQFSNSAEREISLLIRSDGHANVVRYFLKEQKGEFVYLALQLCCMSLKDFVIRLQRSRVFKPQDNTSTATESTDDSTDKNTSALSTVLNEDIPDEARKALLQVAEGLAHLHSQRIVHRDIKPHNILCAYPDDGAGSNKNAVQGQTQNPASITSLRDLGNYVLKISDMGLSKQLEKDDDSFTSMSFSFPAQAPDQSLHSHSLQSTTSEGTRDVNEDSTSNGKKAKNNHADNGPVGTIGWQAPELMALRGVISGKANDDGNDDADDAESEDNDEENYETDYQLSKKSRAHNELSEELESKGSQRSSVTHSNSLEQRCDSTTSSTINLKYGGNSRYERILRRRRTQNVDIFSLGCVFHYVLVPGEHPFGKWYEREANIMMGKLDLSHMRMVLDAKDLLERMLRREPEHRPSASQVCHHPFFWSSQKRLDFFIELSDRLEHESADSPLVIALETNAVSIVGRSWNRKLHQALLEDMGRYRKYDTTSVRDLLRVIRNKRHHYHELADTVKEVIGVMPIGFINYFESRFPKLLLHCVHVACTYVSQDKNLRPFCEGIVRLFGLKRYTDPDPLKQPASGSPVSSSAATVASNIQESTVNENCSRRESESIVVKKYNDEEDISFCKEVSANINNEFGKVVDFSERKLDAAAEDEATSFTPQDLSNVVVWYGSALAASLKNNNTVGSYSGFGWWRHHSTWASNSASSGWGVTSGKSNGKARTVPSHIIRSSTDMRYRSRLCTHWEMTGGLTCPMKKKGKCDFAHGPIELRIKESRRDRWGQIRNNNTINNDPVNFLRLSGGEDVLGAARSIERVRVAEGSVSEFEKTSSLHKKMSSHLMSTPPQLYSPSLPAPILIRPPNSAFGNTNSINGGLTAPVTQSLKNPNDTSVIPPVDGTMKTNITVDSIDTASKDNSNSHITSICGTSNTISSAPDLSNPFHMNNSTSGKKKNKNKNKNGSLTVNSSNQ